MRIIAGTAGGRKLVSPEGLDVRPTTDRVREAVFNTLYSRDVIEDARVLDVFAGTGAYGLEALSRGAAHVTCVDIDRRSIGLINDNLDLLGFTDQATVLTGDAVEVVGRFDTPFDIAFADPPYDWSEDQWRALLAVVPAALLVAESDRELDELVAADETLGWVTDRSRRYGSTVVTLLQPMEGSARAQG